MNSTFIFTEIINAGPIGCVMLKSFLKHHKTHRINVYGTNGDFVQLHDDLLINPNLRCINVGLDTEIMNAFKTGHLGTAMIFARAWSYDSAGYSRLIHIDSDIYFKKESLSLITASFNEGYDIIGSRRCYEKNPGGAIMKPGTPDAISTYFTGWNKEKLNLNEYSNDQFIKMWQGAYNPLGFPILDFGDPVCFAMLNNGAKIKFLDSNLIGGQDENGSKKNNYPLNMHMDNGAHLIHFGGVASGYAYHQQKSNPEKSYAEWAVGRWALFNKVFYDGSVECNKPTVYGPDGRWVDGCYDESILEAVKEQL